MSGFCLSPVNKWNNEFLTISNQEHYEKSWIASGNIHFFHESIKKFENDKLFEKKEDYFLIMEGALLNKRYLFGKYNTDNLSDLLLIMYNGGMNETFFSEFRGPFSGALYDDRRKKVIVFTNQTGEKPVYYYKNDEQYIIASQLNWIYSLCHDNSLSLTIDENGVYNAITFGFMEDDSTYAKEIKRLRGGYYIEIDEESFSIKRYHSFSKNSNRFFDKSEDELIEIIDEQFRNAVLMEYEKDLEYGYYHIADMSGGLDSRMNVWVAHEMGYHDFQLLTYCKANYQDELIAKQVAAYWKDALIIKPLDDLQFFYDNEKIVRMNGGTSAYIGITGGQRLLDLIDWTKYGIEHTGLIGDAVLGCFFKNDEALKNRVITGKFSEKLTSRINKGDYFNEFQDHEIYLMYTRCFQGACNTVSIRNFYTETCSPFMDVEFLQLCMDIPIEYRANHYIYKKWILKKYPEAAKYRWESINGLITEKEITIKLRKVIERGPKALLRKLGVLRKSSDNGMNPLDYWIETDESVKQYLSNYVMSAQAKANKYMSNSLCSDLKYLFSVGNAMEKCMVVTAYNSLLLMLDL